MRTRRRWMNCALALALTACLGGARAAGQSHYANAPAAPPATPLNSTAQPPPAPDKPENYERLPFMTQTQDEVAAPSAGGLLLRTLGALLLIVGLIVATAWGLRRLGNAQFNKTGDAEAELAVLSTVSLGERRQVSAVRFGDRLLLIGSTTQAITLLAKSKRRPQPTTPPMRSVAELLAEDEPPSFEQTLSQAQARIEQHARTNQETL